MHIKAIFALSTLLAFFVSTPSWAKTDKEFLTDALKGDNSEISLGNLALQKASNASVKQFGQTLITDHTKAKKDALTVASAVGAKDTTDLTDEAKNEMTKLTGLSGTAFDKEFVSFMVKDHRKDVSDFKDEAKTGAKSVASLAKRTLPALEKHLKIAESLAAKV